MSSQTIKSTCLFILGIIILGIITGCSGGGSNPIDPIIPQTTYEKTEPGNLDTLPVIAFDDETAIGVMGGYNLTISDDGTNAEIVPMRTSAAVGDSYIVSGKAFFTMTPCHDCLKIDSVSLDPDGDIILGFAVKHPFPKGSLSEPETAKNRLDLDIFDLAMVVQPIEIEPAVPYSLGNINPGVVKNADGYTPELVRITGKNVLLPYKICYEKANNNRFEMGTGYQLFDVVFKRRPSLSFDLYLTMGYGASAKKGTKLNPVYYIPEFNRKSAWKVEVAPVTWLETDPSTVTIDIYDWNHGATVAAIWPDPAHTNYIRTSSNVLSVSVEMPGMTNAVKAAATIDTTSNGWDDPLTYTATFSNEKSLASGTYTGLVKVTDSRAPGSQGAYDSLMHTSDGYGITGYTIPEFATYQTFIAIVILNNPPVWVSTIGIQSATPDNKKITVTFGIASDPDGDNPVTYDLYYSDQTATSNNNPFTAPNTIVPGITSPFDLTSLTNDHIYWLGVRAKDSKGLSEKNTVKLSATPANNPPVWNSTIGIQSATGGNTTISITFGTATDPDGDNPVTYDLYYADKTATGNTDPFISPNTILPNVTSPYNLTGLINCHIYWLGVRAKDSFGLSETNTVKIFAYPIPAEPTGLLIWAKRAGGPEGIISEHGYGITSLSDNSTVVTGVFGGSATFGPGEPNQTVLTSAGGYDIFIAKYNPDGTLAWANRAGGSEGDYGRGITTLSDNSTVMIGSYTGPATFGGGFPQSLTGSGSFIARYNSNGTLAWVKRVSYSSGACVTALSDNSTVLTGHFDGSDTFGEDEPNETVLISAGSSDIFIARYNPDGTLAWAKRAGGLNGDGGNGITTLSDNSTIVTGSFSGSATFGLTEPNQTTLNSAGSHSDIFIARYNSNGTLAWAKRAGGVGYQESYGITTLSDNSTVVTGFFGYLGSATFGPGELNQTVLVSTGAHNIFIARYNPDGTLAWVKQAGGLNGDFGNGITTLSDNSTVVTGRFGAPSGGSATFGAGEPNETTLASPSGVATFVARYNPDGTLAWAKRAGGSEGNGITSLSDNSTVVTGYFGGSTTFGPGEPNETVLTSAGGMDIFVARFAP
jgi:hypothetical protein